MRIEDIIKDVSKYCVIKHVAFGLAGELQWTKTRYRDDDKIIRIWLFRKILEKSNCRSGKTPGEKELKRFNNFWMLIVRQVICRLRENKEECERIVERKNKELKSFEDCVSEPYLTPKRFADILDEAFRKPELLAFWEHFNWHDIPENSVTRDALVGKIYDRIKRKKLWREALSFTCSTYSEGIDNKEGKEVKELQARLGKWERLEAKGLNAKNIVGLMESVVEPQSDDVEIEVEKLRDKIVRMMEMGDNNLKLIDKGLFAERLDLTELKYAPSTESEVIFLAGVLAARGDIPLRVREIGRPFPDMKADYYTKDGWQEKRIEFEFRSLNFELHGHDSSKCDMIICWEDNWVQSPKHIEIIELRNFVKRKE